MNSEVTALVAHDNPQIPDFGPTSPLSDVSSPSYTEQDELRQGPGPTLVERETLDETHSPTEKNLLLLNALEPSRPKPSAGSPFSSSSELSDIDSSEAETEKMDLMEESSTSMLHQMATANAAATSPKAGSLGPTPFEALNRVAASSPPETIAVPGAVTLTNGDSAKHKFANFPRPDAADTTPTGVGASPTTPPSPPPVSAPLSAHPDSAVGSPTSGVAAGSASPAPASPAAGSPTLEAARVSPRVGKSPRESVDPSVQAARHPAKRRRLPASGEPDEDDEHEDLEDAEEVEGSKSPSPEEPHAADLAEQRLAAIDLLKEIEVEFADLRDKLYHDKLLHLTHETALCESGQHPELVKIFAKINEHYEARLRSSRFNLSYKLERIDKETRAARIQLHQQFLKDQADLKLSLLNDTTKEWYKVNRERRLLDSMAPEYSYHVAGLSRLELVQQRNSLLLEVSELTGLNRYQGFPTAPHIRSATLTEIDSDLEYLAAYLLLVNAGNATPSVADVKSVLESVAIEVEESKIEELIASVAGKSVEELIAEGNAKLSSAGPIGGSSPAAASGSSSSAAAAEEVVEEAAEESDDDMGFGLFD